MHIDRLILSYAYDMPNVEVCGYVSAEKFVVPVPNVSPDPSSEWRMPAGSIPDDALAVWHSHPHGPACPSSSDMIYQYTSALPHGIAVDGGVFWFGDGVPTPRLIGREFRHGVTDCYELIKDAYAKLFDIELPHFPRDWKWWKDGKSLYEDGFKSAGFHEIDSADILPGDCFLFSILSKTPNHAAVWLGDELILHHLSGRKPYDPTRLSKVENVGDYGRFISKALRHENHSIDRAACAKIRQDTAIRCAITN